jgi:hypothetical protein
MNLERAVRNKYRFNSPQGPLSLEDLWDLPLQTTRAGRADLNGVAVAISRDLKAQEEESFVNPRPNALKVELADKLDIVKHIIEVRQNENALAASAAERKRQKEQLTEILHIRTQQDLLSKSPAEIEAMIKALDTPEAAAAPAAAE